MTQFWEVFTVTPYAPNFSNGVETDDYAKDGGPGAV